MNSDSFSRSFFAPDTFGVVEVTGNDAGSFLHRMSTNNIDILQVSEFCLTTFINQKARLVAACYVQRIDTAAFRLVIPYALAEHLMQWLDQYLFVEDVTLRDLSHELSLFWVLGGQRNDGIRGPDFQLVGGVAPTHLCIYSVRDVDAEKERLRNSGFYELSGEEFESLRVASEVVFSTHEINEAFNPIQLGLSNAIHWAKGCYIGQEVISRLESKDKSTRSVVGIRVDRSTWEALHLGETISVNNAPMGTLSSVAPLYLADSINALVLFKKTDIPRTFKTDLSNVLIDITKETD